jgi:hypothetical protein
MGRPTRTWAAATTGGLLAPVLLGVGLALASCGVSQSCGGQCGPPFQLQVIFRPGTSTQTATAAMNACAADPLVLRIGRMYRFRGPADAYPPGSLTATVYTRAMWARSRELHLLTCLRRSPSVTFASYPD